MAKLRILEAAAEELDDAIAYVERERLGYGQVLSLIAFAHHNRAPGYWHDRLH